MQMKHLTSFVTVAKTRNMAQTALVLNYSHSTIYSHIDVLEKEFGVKLYHRTSHGIELTSQGEIFLQYAEKLLNLYEETHRALSQTTQSTLRIGASEASDFCLMHKLMREFISRANPVEVEYSKMTVDMSLMRLIAGNCDIAFICDFDFTPESVYSEYLCTLKLIFVTGSPVQFEGPELPKLLGTMKMPMAQKIMHSIGLQFDDYFSSLTTIGDLSTIKQLLYYNSGVAMLPEIYAEADLKNGSLLRIPSLMQEVELSVYIVAASKNRIGPYTKELINLAFSLYNPKHLSRCIFSPLSE